MMYDIDDTVHCDEWDGVIVGFHDSEITGQSYVIGVLDEHQEMVGVEIIPCWWLDDVGVAH